MDPYERPGEEAVEAAYRIAFERFATMGVDADAAIERALQVPVSLHCWQADDVAGLETRSGAVDGGGILATGNYPGRARDGDEMRQDFEQVLALLPGTQRLNLHAFYAETGSKTVDRDAIEPAHFARWIEWSRQQGIALDFNPTYFAHPKANDGFTLSHADRGVRDFWIQHGIASRRIAQQMAASQGAPCMNNHWVPDGAKDSPADRWSPRARLAESYDRIFDASHGIDTALCVDAVESKLFGIGSEDYVVGSLEFYASYALSRGIVQCLDLGHFHPTESVADKLSALLAFQKTLLLHTSRPIRWDSDHVVLFTDEVRNLFLEVRRGDAFDRVYVALDFFDASINRIMAYVIGTRATRKGILAALLDPTERLQALEREGRLGEKLALMEEQRCMPIGAVWDMLCLRADVPPGAAWIPAALDYEKNVLVQRSC